MHYRWDENRLYLNCNIQPKAREDRIIEVVGDELKIRISAAPTDGKANNHLIAFLAKLFQVKKSAITIVSGLNNRHKRLCIDNPGHVPDSIISGQDVA